MDTRSPTKDIKITNTQTVSKHGNDP